MAVQIFKQRWLRVVLISLLVIIVILGVAVFFIDKIAEPIITKKAKAAVLTGTDSLYTLNFSGLDLHLLQGKVVLHDVRLQLDSAVYKQKKAQKLAPNNLYDISVKELKLSGVKAFKFYFKKELSIGSITLDAPDVTLSYYQNSKANTIPKDNRTLYQKIKNDIRWIQVDEIALNNARLKYNDNSDAKPNISEVKQININATGLLIDSATQADKTRLMYCQDVVARLDNYTGKSEDGNYNYKIKSLRLSTKTSNVIAKDVYVIPSFEPSTFFDKAKADRFSLHLTTLKLSNFDFLSYREHHIFNAARLVASDGSFGVYSNFKAPAKTNDRIVTFPQHGLKQLKITLGIDTLALKNLDISYTEKNKKTGKVGVIKFQNTTGRFLNVTNNPDSLKHNSLCKASLSSSLFGKVKMDVHLTFDINSPDYAYSYSGHLGPVDVRNLNTAVMPMAMVELTAGRVNSLDFNLHANRHLTTGSVKLLYNNLDLKLLKLGDDRSYQKQGIKSFFANLIIIKHDNPDDGKALPRVATVRFERPINFPFFKTLWRGILSGIKTCVGVKPDKPSSNIPKK